jgi:hypothetical protein
MMEKSMAMVDGIKIDVDRFWKDGFLIIRELFPKDYFEGLRARVVESLRQRERSNAPAVDGLSDPLTAEYIYSPRILEVARTLLGNRDIVYFGDSNYAVVGHGYDRGVHVGGWHRDNTDRSNTNLPDWQGRYSLIRFGFYLQDHRKTSGGLIVRRGTHNGMMRGIKAHMNDRYLNNGMGDVGVWSMRIEHAGLGRCIRGMPWLPLGPRWQALLPELVQAPFCEEERAAFWCSYALDDQHLQRHLDYLIGRTERLEMWRNSYYSPDVLKACASAGLKVIDMPARMRAMIAEGKSVGTHKHHYQMAV